MADDQITDIHKNEIFDRDLIRRRRARMGTDHFLLMRCAQDAAERILDINRKFESALIIGDPQFAKALLKALPITKITHITLCNDVHRCAQGVDAIDPQSLPYPAQSFDIVISALVLHGVNDLPGALFEARKVLRPDGVFIGAMFGGETLTELRQSLYVADDAVHGGISARVSPMVDFTQAAALLQRVGYAQPVIDSDRVTVRYKEPSRLLTDLKSMAETNALTARSRNPVSRRFLSAVKMAYLDEFSDADGKAVATFEILWLTGWAPHESQQKPLKPGSAKTRLADALGTQEQKL